MSFPGSGGGTETVTELGAGEILVLMLWGLATIVPAVVTMATTTWGTTATAHM